MRILLCPDDQGIHMQSMRRSLDRQGVDVRMLPWFGKQSIFSFSKYLVNCMAGADLVNLHWIPFNNMTALKLYRRSAQITRCPNLWTLHNLIPHDLQFGDQERNRQAMTIMAELSQRGVAHCARSRDEYFQTYGRKMEIDVIPVGNYIEYSHIFDKTASRQELNLPDAKLVLMVGPDRWAKGVKEFVETVESLPKGHVGLMVGKCGNPEIRAYLQERAAKLGDRIILRLEMIDRTTLSKYYSAADIFFMPYLSITTSGSIDEAMSHGMPIVTRDIGNTYEWVLPGRNGYLCDTVAEMTASITSIGPKEINSMGRESLEIIKGYDWDDIAKKYIAAYQRTIG